MDNLYVHFPFCRRKCSYCALYSRTGASRSDREAYVRQLSKAIGSLRVRLGSNSVAIGSDRVGLGAEAEKNRSLATCSTLTDADRPTLVDANSLTLTDSNHSTLTDSNHPTLVDSNPSTLTDANHPTLVDSNPSTLTDAQFKTVYFGGGSPALCDLLPLAPVLRPLCGKDVEFTVELHPLDVTESKLVELKTLGVNRISMGVQSLDDATLAAMGRGYTLAEAERAFRLVKRHFDNAGIDLIVGYPSPRTAGGSAATDSSWDLLPRLARWGLRHCSVYSLQNERGLKGVPDDDAVLDRLRQIARRLEEMGLRRYEISNYAEPGFECRHNLAVWHGEDYVGLGEGACGRIGLTRTVGRQTGIDVSTVTPEEDLKERTIFRLRTCEGLDASRFPEWERILAPHVQEGVLTKSGLTYRLTGRGTEVCDSILADLV